MTFVIPLDISIFPLESCSPIKSVFHEFSKQPTITEVISNLYARANMFDVIYSLGTFKYDQLKNDRPLRVPIPSSYTVELH